MKTYRNLTAAVLVIWFIAALTASALHVFSNGANRLGLSIAVASLAPILLFFLFFAFSSGFRSFALRLSPSTLTALQIGRIIGFSFLLLEARRALPAIFALPAGYGDMFIGATATLVAWKLAKPSRRGLFTLWQLLGILDLVTAVGIGTTAPLLDPLGVNTALMTVLPLSLIPVFFVPLYFIFHIICIAQARSWKTLPANTTRSFTSAQPTAA